MRAAQHCGRLAIVVANNSVSFIMSALESSCMITVSKRILYRRRANIAWFLLWTDTAVKGRLMKQIRLNAIV